jgi:hypothetical protein
MTTPSWFGYGPPFVGGQEGVFSRQVDEKLIKNDLLQLLLTAYGERVMRPTFGSPIRASLFDNMTRSQLDILENGISDVIQEYEPRVVVSSVSANISDDNTLTIKVYGSFNVDINNVIVASTNTNNILVELDLPTNKLGSVENSNVTRRSTA